MKLDWVYEPCLHHSGNDYAFELSHPRAALASPPAFLLVPGVRLSSSRSFDVVVPVIGASRMDATGCSFALTLLRAAEVPSSTAKIKSKSWNPFECSRKSGRNRAQIVTLPPAFMSKSDVI